MYSIPTEILIGEQSFKITDRGDYRMVLDCFSALEDPELSKEQRIATSLLIFYEDLRDLNDFSKFPDLEVAVKEMYKFFNGGGEQSQGANVNHKLIDWEQDSQMICSAVNNVAHMEVRSEPYIHWWTFLGYYMAVGESPLATVVGIRDKIVRGKKLEKHELEFQRNNPQYFTWNRMTVEEQEADAYIRGLWNSENQVEAE